MYAVLKIFKYRDFIKLRFLIFRSSRDANSIFQRKIILDQKRKIILDQIIITLNSTPELIHGYNEDYTIHNSFAHFGAWF